MRETIAAIILVVVVWAISCYWTSESVDKQIREKQFNVMMQDYCKTSDCASYDREELKRLTR